MRTRTVLLRSGDPLDQAIARALAEIEDATAARFVFDLDWTPTMELVEILARELPEANSLRSLSLVHSSAAMTFIASAVAARCPEVDVHARRSLWDDGDEDETLDATASKAIFVMAPGERHDAFVRRAVSEARSHVNRRFALVFDQSRPLPPDLADVLFEELLHSGVKEVGLIYKGEDLTGVADSLRLRLPEIQVALASSVHLR